MKLKTKALVIKKNLKEISKPKKGLTLIVNPAGSGKSYETGFFIADMIRKTDRKIYYLTPRIKNLDDLYNGVKKALHDNSLFSQKVLKIDSFRNAVTVNKNHILKNKVTNSWQESQDLANGIEALNSKNLASTIKDRIREQLFDVEDNFEFRFRKRLSEEFINDYNSRTDRSLSEYEFMKNSKWNFIEKIYPSAGSSDKQVFILTSKKFFMKNDPIISSSYFFTEKDRIEDALIIIDEIDAIKSDMLDIILNNQFDNDIVDLFGIIYKVFLDVAGMDTHVIALTKSESLIKEIKTNGEALKTKYFPFQWAIRHFDIDEETNELQEVRLKTKIMNYQGVHAYYDGKKKYRYVPYIPRENDNSPLNQRCNTIIPAERIPEELNAYMISEFLKEIIQFVHRTFRIFYNMATEYMTLENKRIKEEKTEESLIDNRKSITTILGKLNFDKENARKIADYIISVAEYRRYSNVPSTDVYKKSVYNRGLYYNSISEFDEFRHSAILNYFELPYTPELMLLSLCTKAHVVGISATADTPNINNFNFSFIRNALNNPNSEARYHCLSSQQLAELKKDYENKTKGYEKIDTQIKKIDIAEYPCDTNGQYHEVIKNLAYLNTKKINLSNEDFQSIANNIKVDELFIIQNKLCEKISSSNNELYTYDYNRIKKIWLYIDSVLSDSVTTNGIITTQKLVRESGKDDIFNIDNIILGATYSCMRIFNLSVKDAYEKAKNMFVIINAEALKDDDQSNFKKIKEYFKNNDNIFMLTSYASVSRGNNLQINIGKKEVENWINNKTLFLINKWKLKGEIDWDSIYIEKPAYVIPSLMDSQLSNGYVRNLSYKEKLKTLLVIEEVSAYHQLDRYNKKNILKEFFTSFEEIKPIFPYYNSLYMKPCIKAAYTVFLYQTIGRISRTNVKKEHNAIYYDSEIIDFIEADTDTLKLPIITHEFNRFLKVIKEERTNELKLRKESSETTFSEQNIRMTNLIENLLDAGNFGKEKWYPELRKLWQDIRKLVLKYPVITKSKLKEVQEYFNSNKCVHAFGLDIKDLYINFSSPKTRYFYGLLDDNYDQCKNIIISDDNNKNSFLSKIFSQEVSINECRLSMLLNNPEIKKHWQKHGFDSSWKIDSKEDFYGILCPVIYTNIYKGAIGEEVIKAIFNSLGIKCHEIDSPHAFEKFDFIIKENGKTIGIDAKNFSELSLTKNYANEELLIKTTNKIKELELDYGLVINVIDETGCHNMVSKSKCTFVPGIFQGKYLNDCAEITIRSENNVQTVIAKIYEIISSIIHPSIKEEGI